TPPPVDPTREQLARIGAEEAEQLLAARAADRQADALEKAKQSALAESRRWRRREDAVRGQIEGLANRADALGRGDDKADLGHDVLAHERDAAKAALAKARSRSSYAVLPHKGPNGTWRRPIVIECGNGMAKLQPKGPAFSLLEMGGLLGMRSNPLVVAVA